MTCHCRTCDLLTLAVHLLTLASALLALCISGYGPVACLLMGAFTAMWTGEERRCP